MNTDNFRDVLRIEIDLSEMNNHLDLALKLHELAGHFESRGWKDYSGEVAPVIWAITSEERS